MLLLSLAIGVAQGLFLLHGFERYAQASQNALIFEDQSGEIARLDEVLTMSARLHAATGDLIWRTRYLDHVEPLDAALERAFSVVQNEEALAAIAEVADSNAQLIAMEDRSLALTETGQLDAAFALLNSADYQREKANYSEGLDKALQISRTDLQTKIEGHRDALLNAAFVVVVSLLIMSELWRHLSVSERQQAARQIEASLEREQRLGCLQRQFVSMLSHELRTPLAIIDGKAQRLIRRADRLATEQIEKSGSVIHGAVLRLTELMEGVLNVSKMEEGRIDVVRDAFDPAVMITDVVVGYREVNPRRSIEVELRGLPKQVEGDPRLLAQVISNLVSNAVKYSSGDTTVKVESYRENGEVVIAVHDEGVGIPQQEIEKLGQRFFRASSAAGIAGTGIGLHFICHLIDLHDGRMEVRSTEGLGSSFIVRLPLPCVEEPATEVAPSAGLEPGMSEALPVH